jgi:hypothetical protein
VDDGACVEQALHHGVRRLVDGILQQQRALGGGLPLHARLVLERHGNAREPARRARTARVGGLGFSRLLQRGFEAVVGEGIDQRIDLLRALDQRPQ